MKKDSLLELLRYGVIGVLTTLVSWLSFALLERLLGVNPANVLSWVLAVAFAFAANKIYVFRSKSWARKIWLKEALSFLAARLASGAVEILGLPLLMWIGLDQPLFGTEGMVAKIAVTVLVQVLNYGFSKALVFKKQSLSKK